MYELLPFVSKYIMEQSNNKQKRDECIQDYKIQDISKNSFINLNR